MTDQEPATADGVLPYIEECVPIDTFEALYHLAQQPPSWALRTRIIMPRSKNCIENKYFDCHTKPLPFGTLPERVEKERAPRTIVCHDMKNGYLEDRFCDPVPIGNGYVFTHWRVIDIFIYFSHHFITIPPLAWINQAHSNGVQILGTIITEWSEGQQLCDVIFGSEEECEKFVNAVVEITAALKLDGWLINIENHVHPSKVYMLIIFLQKLTAGIRKRVDKGIVIWYDSVIHTGELQWQNELNANNRCFFDICDGIFLNYSWTEKNLAYSAAYGADRLNDIYVGIDIFGRNTPYTAGLGCHAGIKTARNLNLSIAIFAPGWTHETISPLPTETFFSRFLKNDQALWASLWGYLYTHPLTHCFRTEFNLGASETTYELESQGLQLLHDGCCFHRTVVGDDCSYETRKNCHKIWFTAWHHLFALDMDVLGRYAIMVETRRAPATNRRQMFVVVVVLEENGKVTHKSHTGTSSVIRVEPYVIITRSYFQFDFNKPAKLLHIYLQLPFLSQFISEVAFYKENPHPSERMWFRNNFEWVGYKLNECDTDDEIEDDDKVD